MGNTCRVLSTPRRRHKPSARPLRYNPSASQKTSFVISTTTANDQCARVRARARARDRRNGGPRTSARVSKPASAAVNCAEATSLLLLTCRRRRCACTNKGPWRASSRLAGLEKRVPSLTPPPLRHRTHRITKTPPRAEPHRVASPRIPSRTRRPKIQTCPSIIYC